MLCIWEQKVCWMMKPPKATMLKRQVLLYGKWHTTNLKVCICATNVRQAIESGLESTDVNFNDRPSSTRHAKNYSSYLPKKEFLELDLKNYSPQEVDIAVFEPYPEGKTTSGHIQIFDGKNWISDWVQRNFWPSSGYLKYNTDEIHYKIFR